MTIPVVPRIEIPPTMPRRPLSVFLRDLLAVGHRDLDLEVGLPRPRPRRSPAAIIWRGTGLIAGSPGGIGRPGRVTMPTPGPASNVTPAPGAPRRTVALTSAPWVTSGSSPASLTMPAVAKPSPSLPRQARRRHAAPPGSADLDRIGKLARHQRRAGRLGRGGGAGAGRPAAAQRAGLFGSWRCL